MTRLLTLLGLIVPLALPGLAQAAPPAREKAMHARPEVAAKLDSLVIEVATWKTELAGDCGAACDRLGNEVASLEEALDGLWTVVAEPEGQRERVDKAYTAIWSRSDGLERWLPQSDIEDLDGAMRRWSGTRERIDRFRRTLRELSSDAG